jgi:hypothetical protein
VKIVEKLLPWRLQSLNSRCCRKTSLAICSADDVQPLVGSNGLLKVAPYVFSASASVISGWLFVRTDDSVAVGIPYCHEHLPGVQDEFSRGSLQPKKARQFVSDRAKRISAIATRFSGQSRIHCARLLASWGINPRDRALEHFP